MKTLLAVAVFFVASVAYGQNATEGSKKADGTNPRARETKGDPAEAVPKLDGLHAMPVRQAITVKITKQEIEAIGVALKTAKGKTQIALKSLWEKCLQDLIGDRRRLLDNMTPEHPYHQLVRDQISQLQAEIEK